MIRRQEYNIDMTKNKVGSNQHKKVKVFINGKRTRDIRLYQTWYERAYRWCVKIIKISLWGTVGVLAAYALFWGYMHKNPVEIARAEDVSTAVFENKIESMKDKVVSDVAVKCESKGLTAKDAPMILDTNKKMSLGIYMFQVTTVQHYYKTLYGKQITRQEATQIAFDEEKAHELAKRIMFETNNKANDWFNCAKLLGTNQQIDLIKSLE